MKLGALFFLCVIIIIFSGCHNVWMEQVLQPKTITFESNGGSYVKPQIIYKYEKISEPQAPSKDNCIFDGWYMDNDNFTNRWNFNDVPEKDMTLYAKWRTNDNNQYDNFFSSVDELEAYLKNLSPSDNPYDIVLNVDNLTDVAKIINNYPDIYINLILTGSNVDSIGYFDFHDCKTLISVIIPNNVTSIEAYSFSSCSNLTSVIIPDSVTGIDINAFYECTSLISVTIPNSVAFIGECAFFNCDNLTSVTFEGTISRSCFRDYAFFGDLREVFYAVDANNGTPGTYIRSDTANMTWTKQ